LPRVAMSTLSEAKLPIIVTGDNIELTPALLDHATKKMEKVVARHREFVTKCEVHMNVGHNPSVKDNHEATVTLSVKGNVIRDTVRTGDMYASLDGLSHMAARKLRKFKEQRRNRLHEAHGSSAIREAKDDEEGLDDFEVDDFEYAAEAELYNKELEITKIKSFSMEPITPEEAAIAIDYIDHPFYVFRNKDTGEVSVLYKRNSGGLGLIEPSE